METRSSSPAETEAIAARLAEGLAPGDVVTISGELGSGKTTFVRGACRALGVTAPVTSPTYTIGHRYEGSPDVSHLDLYRFTAVSHAEWDSANAAFHDQLVAVAGNELLASMLEPLHGRLAWLFRMNLEPERVCAEHEELQEAIAAGDADLAAEVAQRHVLSSRRMVLERMLF